ncbi:MAG: DNA-formamidopyrimidine glycosylase family protein [Nanoarchaeota archaeon]
MPELPEVETIVSQLNQKVIGKEMVSAEIYDSAVVDPKIKTITPVKISKIWRRGKLIIFELSDGNYLLAHLRLTGHFHFFVRKQQEESNRNNKCNHKFYLQKDYLHFIAAKFTFSDASFLTFNSIRKFERMQLADRNQLQEILAKYGPEPLESTFTLDEFRKTLASKRNANIKTTLMDYKVIAGIGNIYAQEMLYHAGISPLHKIGSLSSAETERLYLQMKKTLISAIKYKGSTVDNYSNLEGEGSFQKRLAVYNKSKCEQGHPLKKINLGGRGTSYCPICQK